MKMYLTCVVLVIARHMRWGRQEDAHEFLRYVVDALQRSALTGLSKYVLIVVILVVVVIIVVVVIVVVLVVYMCL